MTSNFNKKKLRFLPSRQLIKYTSITIIIFSFFSLVYYELINRNKYYTIIQNLSKKFDYQFTNFEINTLKRVDRLEVIQIISNYYNQSIFLLPLDQISKSLYELRWIKKVNLSVNFINTVKVEILEYEPIGLLFFNDQLFYFSSNEKIIDKYSEDINENLIIFHGKQAIKEANNFINIISKTEFIHKVKEAYYINERRWDVILDNNILLYLSEKNLEDSVNNYIKLINKFDNSDIIKIKRIDLRNNEKAIISFK